MRAIRQLIPVFILLLSCADTPERSAEGKSGPEARRNEDEWTAGIVADSTLLPPDTFALVTDVRAARHEKFDRIVFQFSGPGIPGYHIEYIDEPVRMCGSGKPLYLPGDGWLMIRFSSARMHEAGKSTVEKRERTLDLPIVLKLVATCDFENIVTWVAAVSTPNRYRVRELENPARLVVDIRH